MASIKPQIADLARNTEATVDVDKIAVPFTTIIGREPIRDLSKIPAPKMGIERVQGFPIVKQTNESGPNGESVYTIFNDKRAKLVSKNGPSVTNSSDADGARFVSDTSGDFVEITFYGTGLNVLVPNSDGSRDCRYTVDGGSESPGSFLGTNISPVLQTRGYAKNEIQTVVSGLTLGMHTVKLTSYGWLRMSGFEILNETAQLSIPAGNVSGELIASQSLAFDSGFDIEQGTSGTKGGHVVVYNENNQTKKAIRYVDTTQGNLGSADHSNEEVTARHHWRNFGAGRGDDFSTLITSSDRAFTLDDGTTTLVGDNVGADDGNVGIGGLYISNPGFLTLTFVGTGLDIVWVNEIATATRDIEDILVNGVSIGSITVGTPPANFKQQLSIVSGLPYGTHTVKFVNSAPDNSLGFEEFIIYGPKKPEIPANSTELGSYNLMADYVANTGGTGPGSTPVSQGALTKYSTREYLYSGSWSMNFSASDNATGGFTPTSTSGYLEYSAFCTGFEYRGVDGGSAGTISINGSTDFTGSGLNTTETLIGGATFNESTGAFGGSNWQDGIAITGLPLGLHTFRVTATGVGSIAPISLAPIVPIHIPKADRNLLRDDLIGSNSIKSEVVLPDFRKGKVSFPDGVDLGASGYKWQRKELTANIQSNGFVEELSFHGLTVGKTYQVSFQGFVFDVGSNELQVNLQSSSAVDFNEIASGFYRSNSTNERQIMSFTSTFVAKTPSLLFNAVAGFSGSSYITTTSTHIILTELPNHKETNEW